MTLPTETQHSMTSARQLAGVALALLVLLLMQLVATQYVLMRIASKDAQLAQVEQRVGAESRRQDDDEESVDVLLRAAEERMRGAWRQELDHVRTELSVARARLADLDADRLSAAAIEALVQKRTDDAVAQLQRAALKSQSTLLDDAALRALGATRIDSSGAQFAVGRADITFVVPLLWRRDVQHTLLALRRLVDAAGAEWWQRRGNRALLEAVFVCADDASSLPDSSDLLDVGRLRIAARLVCSSPARALERVATIGAKLGTSDTVVLWSAALQVLPESRSFLTHIDALDDRTVLGAIVVQSSPVPTDNSTVLARAVMCAGVEFHRFAVGPALATCRFADEKFSDDAAWWLALENGAVRSMALASLPIAVRWSALAALGSRSAAPAAPAGEHNEVLDLTLRAASLGADVKTSSAVFELTGADAKRRPSLEVGAHWSAYLADAVRPTRQFTLLWDVLSMCRHALSTNAGNTIVALRESDVGFRSLLLLMWCHSWSPSTSAILQLDALQYKPGDEIDVWLSYRPPSRWPTFNASLGEQRPAVVIGRVDGWDGDHVKEILKFADRVDEIWVSTVDARAALLASGLVNVELVPDSVDIGLFHPPQVLVNGSRATSTLRDLLRDARSTRILAPTSASNVVLYARSTRRPM
jgi:hypothetical protein